ncbi:MAG: hypothetical protein WCZ66_03335 [Sphingomonadaceae bacterium]
MRGVLLGLILLGAPAIAQEKDDFGDTAADVASQPLRDVGVVPTRAPELLQAAKEAPYSRKGLRTCKDFRNAIRELDDVLGPDVDKLAAEGKPLTGRLAEAGARSIVGSIIPFRGVVREVTGAASAERARQEAVVAGVARRSYLTGYAAGRRCKI